MSNNLFNKIPQKIIKIVPMDTGKSKNSKDVFSNRIIIIAFPPAGGWVTLKRIMKKIPRPTESAITIYIDKKIYL